MVVLIFEGMQGVGKTTLIEQLEKYSVISNSKLPRPVVTSDKDYVIINKMNTEVAKSCILDLAVSARLYVVDRYIASEFVFGNVCHRDDNYAWLWKIDKELGNSFNKLKHNIYTVYVTAPWQFTIDNIWKRRATYTAELMIEKFPSVLKLYEQYLEKSLIPVMRFTNNPSIGVEQSTKALWQLIKSTTKSDAELSEHKNK